MTKRERAFVETVWAHYHAEGRHSLPWRRPSQLRPYPILVSEVMLQQTQAERVVPKFRAFLAQFPSAKALAAAPLGDVLRAWQGLGYNRRAKLLHETARAVTARGGRFPRTFSELRALPGVGPYTAGAVMAFAYNQPTPLIETNVRTVYFHHFFADATDVDDRELWPYIERTLDRARPREWYWALMDYGAHLKQTVGNNAAQSRHYTKQSAFKGSDRQLRGAILRALAAARQTPAALQAALAPHFSDLRVDAQLTRLAEEGLIHKTGRWYSL